MHKGTNIVMKVLVITGVLLTTACGSFASDTAGYTVVEEFNLGPELAETSGLYCREDNSIYSINDSGNEAIIYQLNLSGQIQKQLIVDAKNKDWESLTGDKQNFYVGDIGNNNGKRKFIEIHIVNKNTPEAAFKGSLQIFYANNDIDKNEYIKHDFDAEALVSADDKLLLFSKSWQTGIVHVYQLSKTEAKQEVIPVAEVEGLPGVVTGIDFNPLTQEFLLVGYSVKGLGSFSPFIAKLDRQFKVLASYPLAGFNQVEGICVSPAGEVWISQESSFFSSQKLAKLQLH